MLGIVKGYWRCQGLGEGVGYVREWERGLMMSGTGDGDVRDWERVLMMSGTGDDDVKD